MLTRGEGHHLGPTRKKEPSSLSAVFGVPANKVIRTEKVGSGGYTNLVKKPLGEQGLLKSMQTAEARKDIAFKSIDGGYRRVKAERKKKVEKKANLLTKKRPKMTRLTPQLEMLCDAWNMPWLLWQGKECLSSDRGAVISAEQR
jgi:predicted methyltransferase